MGAGAALVGSTPQSVASTVTVTINRIESAESISDDGERSDLELERMR